MKIVELLKKDCIQLNLDLPSKEAVWRSLAESLDRTGAIIDVEQYLKDVRKREDEGTTGVGFGVAIPHAKSGAVQTAALAMARLSEAVDVASLDGSQADLFFLIAAPLQGENIHLQALSKLAGLLIYEDFLAALRQAATPEEVLEIIQIREEQEGLS
jgi:fructose-specific phosphotransferase system IIA component